MKDNEIMFRLGTFGTESPRARIQHESLDKKEPSQQASQVYRYLRITHQQIERPFKRE